MSERIAMEHQHVYAAGFISAALALLATIIFSALSGTSFEFLPFDHFFTWRRLHHQEMVPKPEGIRIVSIAEESYEKLGVSPLEMWPRKHHAALLKKLKEFGASVVAFDILFHGKGSDPVADDELEQALSSMPTVLASDGIILGAGSAGADDAMKPAARYARAASALGHPLVPASDGRVRRFTSREVQSFTGIPGLPEAALALAGTPAGKPGEYDLINFYGPPGSIPTVPYWKVLNDSTSQLSDYFRGQIVFIGYQTSLGTYASARDSFLTAFPGQTSGVEVHATRAANLLQGNWIRRYDGRLERGALALAVFALSYLLLSLRPVSGMATYFLLIVPGWTLAAYAAFLHQRFVPGFSSLLVLFAAGGLAAVYRYSIESRERKRMTSALQRYLPPKFVKQLVAKQGSLEMEARDTEVALLFTDIAGYTKWTRQTSPDQRTEARRRYFDLVDSAIFAQDGTLLIRMGDGVFAIWGAPVAVDNPRERALRCVLEMRAALAASAERQEIPDFVTRFGLHYGTVQAGSDGSKHRFEYTANGEAVNLASRLEQLNKRFGTTLLLSAAAIEGLECSFDFVPLGLVQPAGLNTAVLVYSLLDGAVLESSLRSTWESALSDFRMREWDEAERKFHLVSEGDERLKIAAEVYLSYCRRCRSCPPEPGWAGQLVFETKE